MEMTYEVRDWITTTLHETWRWFSRLSQQEWFVLLGIVAVLGFLCMRGFTHRGNL